MDLKNDNDKKRLTMLQQAEKHLTHGHSLLYQDDKKLTKTIENQNRTFHHSNIESIVESKLQNCIEIKLNQMIDNIIESLLEQNSIKPIVKSDQKNHNICINITKTNETHNISSCDDELRNNNNDINQLDIKNQNILMERFDQLDKIHKNEMKQMEQNVDEIKAMMNHLNQMSEMQQKQLNDINDKIEQNQSELIKDINNNNNIEGISDRMESIEDNIKEVNEKLDGTICEHLHIIDETIKDITYRNASTLESFIDVLSSKQNHTMVDSKVDVNESEGEMKSNEDEASIINTHSDCNYNDPLLRSMIKHVTTSDEANTLPINVVKSKSGEVLFVESNVEFINLLRLLQDTPIGILSQTIQHHNPFDNLRSSLQNLPNDLFGLSKEDGLISTNMAMADLNYLGLESVEVILETGGSMDCKGSGNGPYICNSRTHNRWKNGVAFCGLGRSFEIALVLPKDSPPGICLGILPDDSNLFDRFATEDVSYNHGFFLYPKSSGSTWPYRNKNYPEIFQSTKPKKGKELRMRFEQEPQKLEYSYDDGPWYQVEIEKGYGIEETTQCCPVLFSYGYDDSPITVTEVKSLDKEKSKIRLWKSNSTFLISNELEISSTTDKMISNISELYKKYTFNDLSTVEIKMVNFGCIELRKLIFSFLNGEQKILDCTFC